MSKEKAKEFVEHLKNNPDLVEKMKGFTQQEFADALSEMKGDGSIGNDDDIAPHLAF